MKYSKLVAAVMLLLSCHWALAQPRFTKQPTNTSVSLGATAQFTVSATSTNPPITWQWWFKDGLVDAVANPSAATYRLWFTNVTLAQDGPYRVVATDLGGSVTSQVATLTVDPTFTKITQGALVTDHLDSWLGWWGDYDNDGRLDVLVSGPVNQWRLYHNDGDALFSAVTNGVMSQRNLQGMSGAWGDPDNDGDLDFYAGPTWTSTESPAIYWNDGQGNFVRQAVDPSWTSNHIPLRGALGAWGDFDHDGFLDAFLESGFSSSWGPITNALLHNNGDGIFAVVTNSVLNIRNDGIQYPYAVDYDNDGALDLVPVRWGSLPTQFYHNDGHGVFTEATPEPIRSELTYTYSAAWADFDNDGDLDVIFGGLGSLRERFYINNGDGTFSLWTGQPARFEGSLGAGWGGIEAWGDFDNDGYLDLHSGADRWRFWRNLGNGSFEEILTGSPVNDSGDNSQSSCWVDFNNDGFLDLFVANRSGNLNYLYMNNGNTNRWLEVKVRGMASDRLAVGAKIFATATIRGQVMRQMRVITASKADQTLVAHFGLGDATNVDLVQIEWPSGNVQEMADVNPNQILSVTEAVGILPVRPTASLNGSVLLRFLGNVGQYQWQLNGVDLAGQTNRTLNLTNVVTDQQGRYSVVASNATTITTNYVYLHVDTTFTKITTGPVVTEAVNSIAASWADYDNDGYLDLLAANASWSGTQFPCSLFHNNGDSTFTKVTTGTLPARTRDSFIGAWGDYNNDGLADLYVANSGTQADDLYRNDGGGVLTRIVPPEGGDIGKDTADGYSAVWGDYDDDGLVDLAVANHSSQNVLVYHNHGDGTFTKVTTNQVGPLVADRFAAASAAWADYDGDGHLDLFVSNDVGTTGNPDRKNRLYRNLGDGTFERVTEGPIASEGGNSEGAAWIDYDNDGWLDLFVACPQSTNLLYRNLGDGSFTAITNSILAQPASKGWQGAWGDYDNDGWLDVFIARGANGANALFHNNGNGLFTKITTGSLVTDTATSMCATWGDYDNDGSLDLFVANGNDIERNSLYRNNGNRNYWVKVKLVGTTSNRSGVGAKVRVRATVYGRSLWQLREISGGGGFEGGQGLIAHFGLGNATQVVTLRVEWPSGAVEEFTGVAPNQLLTIVEPSLGGAFGSDGLFHVRMTGNTNNNYQLSVSSDLVNWTTLTNCAGPGPDGAIEVCDPVPGQAQRFYRLGAP